jgi:hypothetical protein
MSEPLIDVQAGDLHATAHEGDGVITLKLVGTADGLARPGLNQLLGRLHNECNRGSVREVLVDLVELEFMNSSCFKSFITWIVALRRLPDDQQLPHPLPPQRRARVAGAQPPPDRLLRRRPHLDRAGVTR